jgi:hypothetical protein
MAEEKRTRVVPIQVDMKCECGGTFHAGETDFGGALTVLTSYPPKYPHHCDKCGKIEYFTEIYPKIEYEIYNAFSQFSTINHF